MTGDDDLRDVLLRWRSDVSQEITAPPITALQRRARQQRRRRLTLGTLTTALACAAAIAGMVFITRDANTLPSEPSPITSSHSPRPAPDSGRPTLRQIVHDPTATLVAVHVERHSTGSTVSAWWLLQKGKHNYRAIVTSSDRFQETSYQQGSSVNWARIDPPPAETPPPNNAAFTGLVASPVASLASGMKAFVAGGDGATLLPFQVVARSEHGGPWRTYVIPKTGGDQAYDEGDLVLPDGRFMVLINTWSSDRGPTKPGPEYHGLWISAGGDWSRYDPYHPGFAPVLPPSDRVESIHAQAVSGATAGEQVVIATTRQNRLYVSTDGARTFTEERAR